MTEHVDVVIVGAGISGIGAAYRIAERNPGLTYVILERRERIGGTWDLFRYPGVRSDSSIFSLSFPWEPWTRPERVADGNDIRDYLVATARKHGIDSHIRFGQHVRSADWSSATDTWTLRTGDGQIFTGRFVFFATGYYDYDAGYTPDFPGMAQFGGQVIHPQHWPENLDVDGKNVVVIGSGATAISLIPALARQAGNVVMLQRTPTYMISGARVGPVVDKVRKVLPRKVSHTLTRAHSALMEAGFFALSRKRPDFMKRLIRTELVKLLPADYDVDTHFNPPYDPWDQRMCLVTDGDLFEAISAGRAEIVTDFVEQVDATGIALQSGRHLDADVIVTATGLQLQALGGVAVSIDGADIKPQDRFVYKAHMLDNVPNLFWCVGYTNASWTLRADITARATAKLLAHMRARGYTSAYPDRGNEPMPEKPAWDIHAGYVLRNLHALPKSGTKRPWHVRQNYFADALDYRFDRVTESMTFRRSD